MKEDLSQLLEKIKDQGRTLADLSVIVRDQKNLIGELNNKVNRLIASTERE